MTTRPPAEVGMALEEVDTPALLVDLDAFEANLEQMAQEVAAAGVRLRPHAKMHKCAVIGLKQMALGAVGLCCQKVSEAEAMVMGGVPDVLVSNQIVGAPKLKRLAALAREARIGVCVDDADNTDAVSEAAVDFGAELDVLIEIDVGMGRCGVEPDAPALALARHIDRAPNLSFAGLQAYHGRAQHIREFGERRATIEAAAEAAAHAKALIEGDGIECKTITGAGTGTYRFEAASGVYDELQAGSYAFMDGDYARNQDESGGPFQDYRHALFVYATVMSCPTTERAVCDAGLKASSVDCGLPTVVEADLEAEYLGASDEHGLLGLQPSNRPPRIGDKIRLIPGHCDPTVNMYDWYVGVRGGRVEAVWPIAARGALL